MSSDSDTGNPPKRVKLTGTAAVAATDTTAIAGSATDTVVVADAATTVSMENAKEVLLSVPSNDTSRLTSALSELKFIHSSILTEDLQFLKGLQSQQPQYSKTNCGTKIYSMNRNMQNIDDIFLGMKMQYSQLLYEREHYDALYQQILKLWKMPEHIILTGNSGIGKSLFQLYLLRRLLNEETKKFRFVVQQFGSSSFYLYDLETCQVWELEGKDSHIVSLLKSLKKSLYF
jgi:hypothetical protein